MFDAAVKALSQILSPPMRSILWRSIGLALVLITVLAIPMLGESVGPHRWAAVLIGLLGVIVVLRPGAQELTLGHAAALGSAFCNALSSVVVRKIGKEERTVVLLLYPLAGNFILMGLALPFVYVPMPMLDLGGLGIMALLGFAFLVGAHFIEGCRVGGFIALHRDLRRHTAHRVSAASVTGLDQFQ